MKKVMWFISGALIAGTAVSLSIVAGWASVPAKPGAPNGVTDDTALYQNLSEIKIGKELAPNFDQDLAYLSAQEVRYYEKLPSLYNHPRLRAPVKRISNTQYQYGHPAAAKPQK